MTEKTTPFFEGPQDKITKYDGLLGWSANWKCFPDQEDKPVPLDDIISLSPDKQSITILEGETLGQIARDYNCSVQELAEYNNIKKPDLIYPGQIINIPQKHYTLGEGEEESNNNQCVLSFAFEDLVEKPIAGLKVKVITALGDVYEFVTDGLGKINDITAQAEVKLKIYVSSGLGKIKEVASFTPQEGRMSALISSPKVRVKGKSAALTGPAGNVENASAELNKITTGRDSQGKPRVHLNHVCPNSYDLTLGKNIIYWEHIIRASRRSTIIPQSIAAVINAEAAKYPGGVWRPTSVCKDNASSTEQLVVYKSSAAGMTQFLNGTWMSETLKEGTYLYEKALEQGIVAEKPLLNKKGDVVKNKKGEIIYEKKFQISTDIWKSLDELNNDRSIMGITPYPSHATPNVQKWLNQRFDPEYAIMAAVDYGVANLAALKAAGYNIESLNDAEKAKIMYLTHHLGLKNAKRFIKNEITEDAAWRLLKAQVGSKSATVRGKKHGGYVKAHREWLFFYINNNINLDGFFCDELTTLNRIKNIDLEKIITKL